MNFDFLKPIADMKKLYSFCNEAEEFALTNPNISVGQARKAVEYVVKTIFYSIAGDEYAYNVFEMMEDYQFIEHINDPVLMNSLHYIRKMGNAAIHESNINKEEALKVLEELHFVVGEFCIHLGLIEDYPTFKKPGAETKPPRVRNQETAAEKKEDTVSAQTSKVQKVEVEPEVIAKYGPRMRQVVFDVKHGRDEEENKKLYVKACLREAGWPIVTHANQAMPCSAGINMLLDDGDTVDYVLYGRDNRPLAIVEYTSTSKNLIEGRLKSIEKAKKFETKYGYKPIIYYTSGYYIYVIDQLGYKPRRVFQFHTIEELELLKQRATLRKDISNPQIDDSITNRDYQKKAITAACQSYSKYNRHSLLVMATGTGKTRVSISLADILLKAGWVKNILFLADRTSLVRQAHKNFNKLLPSVTTSIYTGSSGERDPNARIIFSTYQTMINLINDDTREFSIGRFDLIIIDEAHRSIFKKYSALFHYFDALMLGLTATPRAEDNKNTYEMFLLPNGVPDYAYELEEAINDGYLVGFSVLDKTTDQMKRGIHYDELSEEERESIEDSFASGDTDTSLFTGSSISAETLQKKKVINIGTIDVMLADLMKNGLKINGGDNLGKTIIFADSHREAEIIVNRFQTLYPHLGLDFCKLIDSQVPGNQSIIDTFGERDNMPQIAVSVDMLDTGIDVPDILNLVFFKRVQSKIKFLQMIGRGTRLSPDVFGPGMDKQGFLIFDYYDNFNFFKTRNTWSTVSSDDNAKSFAITPQSILINQRKLSILWALTDTNALTPFDINYKEKLRDEFIKSVQALNNDDIEVQYNMSYVSKYRTAEQWDSFNYQKVEEIKEHILPLLHAEKVDPKVKTFDLLIYVIEDEVPSRSKYGLDPRKIRHGFGNVNTKIDKMINELLKLKTIPAIVKEEKLLHAMRDADYLYEDFSLERCEDVRNRLRDFMSYIPDKKEYHIINVKDIIIDTAGGGGEVHREKTYLEKVKEYLEKGSVALSKLRNLDELTEDEKAELEKAFTENMGSAADYASWSGNAPLLPFLRKQVGIADEAIKTKFGSFLNDTVLNDKQLIYMNQIVSYARSNGDITFSDLQQVSPFCDVDIVGLFGEKIAYIKELINGLHRPVM